MKPFCCNAATVHVTNLLLETSGLGKEKSGSGDDIVG